MAILSKDFLTGNIDQIKNIQSELTIFGWINYLLTRKNYSENT